MFFSFPTSFRSIHSILRVFGETEKRNKWYSQIYAHIQGTRSTIGKVRKGIGGWGTRKRRGRVKAQTIKYKCIQAANTRMHIRIQTYTQTYTIFATCIRGYSLLSSFVLVVFHLGLRRVSFLSFHYFPLCPKRHHHGSFLSANHAVLLSLKWPLILLFRHMHLLSTKEPKEKHYSHGRNKNL